LIAATVATAIVSYAVTKGLDFVSNDQKQDFESKLRECINETIQHFNQKNKARNKTAVFFYEHVDFIEALIKDSFLVQHTHDKTYDNLEKVLQQVNVQPYTTEELEEFLHVLENAFKKHPLLHALYLDKKFSAKFEEIKNKLDQSLKGHEITQQGIREIQQELKKGAVTGKIPKDLTGPIPVRKAESVIGRETDLKKLTKLLAKEQQALLMNGMGGIGKTTLAATFATQKREAYQHLAWLTLENGLEDALLTHPVLATNLQLDLAGMDAEQQTALILNALNALPGPNLLVLDNARQQLAASQQKLPHPPGWQVLVTSREKITGFTEMPVDFLSETDAIALFERYNNRYHYNTLRQLVQQVEYHTLTIEILAKASKKHRWTAAQTLAALKTDAPAGVAVAHAQHQPEALQNVLTYISRILMASRLNLREKYILQYFSLLPTQPITYSLLTQLLQTETLDWQGHFAATLEGLYEKGFIQKDEEADSYKMHAVLKEAARITNPPESQIQTALLALVTQLLSIDETRDNPVDKFSWVPYGEALKEYFGTITSPEAAELWNNLALVYKALGRYKEAAKELETVLKADLQHFGEAHPTVATSRSNLALAYQDLGRYKEAAEQLETALQANLQHFGEAHPSVARDRSNLATVYQDLGRYEEAARELETALQADLQHFGEAHPTVATSRSNLALAYKALGRYKEAAKELETALQADLQHFGEAHPSVARDRSNLATIYQDLGRFKEAARELETALQANLQHFGAAHPTVATSRSNLATVYKDLGRYEEAAEQLETALKADLQHFGEAHPTVATSRSNLATVYQDLGRYEEAVKELETALQANLQHFGEAHPSVARDRSNLALVYKDLGRYKEAAHLLETALQGDLQHFGEAHPSVAIRRSNLAVVYQALGRYKEAAKELETALKADLQHFGEAHPTVANRYLNLAAVYVGQKKRPKALIYAQKALEIFTQALPPGHPHIKTAESWVKHIQQGDSY
jgi:tetratricopeptide (TPR) repeat protein